MCLGVDNVPELLNSLFMSDIFQIMLAKFRLGSRALYASLSSSAARSLAERLRQSEDERYRLEKATYAFLEKLQISHDLPLVTSLKLSQRHNDQLLKTNLREAELWMVKDMQFLKNAYLTVPELRATDTSFYTHIIAHDILGIGAAACLAHDHGAALWLDLVEDVSLDQRTGDYYRQKFTQAELIFIQSYIETHIRRSDLQFHIGEKQAESFEQKMGFRGRVLPNYRDPFVPNDAQIKMAKDILSAHGLSQGQYWVIPNTLRDTATLSTFVHYLEKMGIERHLVHIGNVLNPIQAQKDGLTISDKSDKVAHGQAASQDVNAHKSMKIISLGSYDYEIYLTLLKLSEAAIMITQQKHQNIDHAMPNRLYDAISVNKPILTYGYKEMAGFITQHKIGLAKRDFPESFDVFQTDIETFRSSYDDYVSHIEALSDRLSWDEVAMKAFSSLPAHSRILIVSRKNLSRHKRTSLMKRILTDMGHRVSIMDGHPVDFLRRDGHYTIPHSLSLTPEDLL